ncbi:MAG: VOC family protein [Planctomycetota bacterium]
MQNRHKLAILNMLGAYPTIVTLLAILGPLMGDTPMPIKAAVLVPLMVGLLTYVVMPIIIGRFAGWLRDGSSRRNLLATAGMLAIIPIPSILADEITTQPKQTATASALDGMMVDHVMINVSDFERSVKWYGEKLGFKETVRWTVDGLYDTDLAYLRRGNFLIELVSSPTTDATTSLPPATDFSTHFAQRGITHLCFKVRDVDATLTELNKKGIPTFSPAIDFPALNVRVGFIQDPDGNVIEFKGPTTGNNVVGGNVVWARRN